MSAVLFRSRACGFLASPPSAVFSSSRRHLSDSTFPVITNAFVSKYDHFRALPLQEKILRLTNRALNLLLNQPNDRESIEGKWKSLQFQFGQENKLLPDYNPQDVDASLVRLLRNIQIPHNIFLSTQMSSATTQSWSKSPGFSYPLEAGPTLEQKHIGEMLPKYLYDKSALIGAATWNGDETFYFLRCLAGHQQARSSIQYVSNIEINSINARLAYLVSNELALDQRRFRTLEGDALTALPQVPDEIAAYQQTIITCRFLPTLNSSEISDLLAKIHENLKKMQGYALVTYSLFSLTDWTHWEHSQSETIKRLRLACEQNILKYEEIKSPHGEIRGVSFIMVNDGTTFQTLFFKETINDFFGEHNIQVVEEKSLGIEGDYQRGISVLVV